MNCELKSDIMMKMKLERIQKDGMGYTFNNEEFDYVFANNEQQQITTLRHYVLEDGRWRRDRHRPILIDMLLK